MTDAPGKGAGMVTRASIVAAARGWLGTPYHHQAALKGVGADCLGLLRGVWREIYGADAERPPAYSRDWAEASAREELLSAARRHLVLLPISDAGAGDVVVFRMKSGATAKHVGLLTSDRTFIHAMEGVCASEVCLNGWWRRRIAAAFRFPGVID